VPGWSESGKCMSPAADGNSVRCDRQELAKASRRTALAALRACNDTPACHDAAFLKSVMGEFYPEVECELKAHSRLIIS
jgi:hypothetical protein